jgi:hypothetical protein
LKIPDSTLSALDIFSLIWAASPEKGWNEEVVGMRYKAIFEAFED